jgi:arylsulfatase
MSAHALRRSLLVALLLAGCSGDAEPKRRWIEQVDLTERLGVPEDGLLQPGAVLQAEVELAPRSRLAVAAQGVGGARLQAEIRRGDAVLLERELSFDGGKAQDVVLPAALQGPAELVLSVPPSAPVLELSRIALEVFETRSPNVIVIIVDTLRADLLLTRRDLVHTPNIDALAADGVPFVEAFAHAPMTLPSHTALFSSRYPFESGVLNNGMSVPADLPLLAEHLADQGYQTLAVVSLATLWPHGERGNVLDRGFDEYVSVPGNVVPAPIMREAMVKALDAIDPAVPLFFFAHFSDPHEPYDRRDTTVEPAYEAVLALDGVELTTVTTSAATYWTGNHELAPGLHRFEVRSSQPTNIRTINIVANGSLVPLKETDGDTGEPVELFRGRPTRHARFEFENRSEEAVNFKIDAWLSDFPSWEDVPQRYLGEVEFVDRYVGELVAELKRRGLYDDSILVFTSDHGEALGNHGTGGHVETLFDELTHVPLIVKAPSGIPTEGLRAQSREVVRHLDVVPTILELAGLPALPGQRGRSLLSAGDRPALSETHRPEAKESQISLRSARLKLIYYVEQDRFELYDLEADPGELRNVFAERGGEVVEWQEQLKLTAELAQSSGGHLEDLSEEQRERMQALGYFGDR